METRDLQQKSNLKPSNYGTLQLITFPSFRFQIPRISKVLGSRSWIHINNIKCPVCFLRFGTMATFTSHITTHLVSKCRKGAFLYNSWTKQTPYYCKVAGCERKFRTKAYFDKHRLSRHSKGYKELRAKIYKRMRNRDWAFKQRFYLITNTQRYYCHKCTASFLSVDGLRRHFSLRFCPNAQNPTTTDLIPIFPLTYHCPYPNCNQFKSRSYLALKIHLRLAHSHPSGFLEIYRATISGAFQKNAPRSCKFCSLLGEETITGSHSELQIHIQKSHGKLMLDCPFRLCKQRFFTFRDQYDHLTKSPSLHPTTFRGPVRTASGGEAKPGLIVRNMYKSCHICPHPGCGLRFLTSKELEAHTTSACALVPPSPPPKTYTPFKNSKTAVERAARKTKLKKKMHKPIVPNPKFTCPKENCGREYLSFGAYFKHVQSHQGNGKNILKSQEEGELKGNWWWENNQQENDGINLRDPLAFSPEEEAMAMEMARAENQENFEDERFENELVENEFAILPHLDHPQFEVKEEVQIVKVEDEMEYF